MFDSRNQGLAQSYRIEVSQNIQCLRCIHHKDELMVLLETLDLNTNVLALTETWIAEEDSSDEYILTCYSLSVVPVLQKNFKRSGGVALYVKNSFSCQPIEFVSDIQCMIIGVQFTETYSTSIRALHRRGTLQFIQFLPKIENRLHF